MKSIQALRERFNALNKQANHLLAEKGEQTWTKEDQAKFDGFMDECERLNAQIAATQRMLDSDAENQLDEAQREAAARAQRGGGAKADKVRDAVAMFLRLGNNVTAEQAIEIRAAMSTGTGSEGGYTVPTTIASELVEALKAFGGMREVAEVLPTDSGEAMNYPTSDSTSEEGEIVAENAAVTTGETTFGTVGLNVFKYSSKKIALPLELIQDSKIDVIALVMRILATRLGRITNKHYTIGTGSGQPFGVVARSTAGKTGTTGQTTTVIYDDLEDLLRSVNRAYRSRARWMMSDLSLGKIRKLKDTAGRPIFTPSYEAGIQDGEPDRLLGKPITINDDVPVMAANAKSILFGDFSTFKIRDAMGLVIRRFDDSAFALNGQVGFCGWMRTGSNLMDTGAVKHYANSAT